MEKGTINEINKIKFLMEKIEKKDFPIKEKSGYYKLNEATISRILRHGEEEGIVIVSASRSSTYCSYKPEIELKDEYVEFCDGDTNAWDENAAANDQPQEYEEEFLRQRNNKCDAELRKLLRESPFSFSEVYGGYKTESFTDAFERSYIIYCMDKPSPDFEKQDVHKQDFKGSQMSFDELYSFAKEIGTRFKQDSIYVQKPGESPNYVDPRTDEICNSSSSKDVKINDFNEPYFTTGRRDKDNPQRFTADIQFENFRITKPCSIMERMRNKQKYGQIYLD